MIPITATERIAIQKEFPGKSLPHSGRGKKASRKSYQVLGSDKETLKFLAAMRGTTVRELTTSNE